MSAITSKKNEFQSAHRENPSYFKNIKCQIALTIIGLIGELRSHGIGWGLNFCRFTGRVSDISHLKTKRSTFIGLTILFIKRCHKKMERESFSLAPMELVEEETFHEISPKAFKQRLQIWIEKAAPNVRENYEKAAEKILHCFEEKSDILWLAGLNLNSLPKEIGLLKISNLKELHLTLTHFTSFPYQIFNFKKLEKLTLSDGGHLVFCPDIFLPEQFFSLPEQFYSFSNLKELNLSNNSLTSLPTGIDALGNLEQLNLAHNFLSSLPAEISALCKLKNLCLEKNHFTSLSEEILSLGNLETLFLDHNSLTLLPTGIIRLSKLTALTLDHNPISSLPEEVLSMQDFLEIFIDNCNFSERALWDLIERMNIPEYNGPTIEFSVDEEREEENRTLEELLEELSTFAKWNKLFLKNLVDDAANIESLHSWLARLSVIGDYKNKRESLAILICQILEKAEVDPAFRDIFWGCLLDASTTCGDRMALSILYLGMHYQIAECFKEKNLAKLAYLLGHGLWALSQLEEIAKKKVETLACVDEIEVYLAYPIKLKDALKLPIVLESMLYFQLSSVTQQDLASAEARVKESLADSDAYAQYLAGSDIWQKALLNVGNEGFMKLIAEKNASLGKLDETAPIAAYQQIDHDFKQGLLALTFDILSKEVPPPFFNENGPLNKKLRINEN